MSSCSPLTVILVGADTPPLTASDGVTPVFTGDNFGVALGSGEVTCCAEAVIRVGVKYNAQWQNDGAVNYGAQVN